MKFLLLVLVFSMPLQAEVRKITLVNYEIEGTKQWVRGQSLGMRKKSLKLP